MGSLWRPTHALPFAGIPSLELGEPSGDTLQDIIIILRISMSTLRNSERFFTVLGICFDPVDGVENVLEIYLVACHSGLASRNTSAFM